MQNPQIPYQALVEPLNDIDIGPTCLGLLGINSLDFKSMIMNKLAWFMNMGRQHIYTCVYIYIYITYVK